MYHKVFFPPVTHSCWLLPDSLLYFEPSCVLADSFLLTTFPWVFFSNTFPAENKNVTPRIALPRPPFPDSTLSLDASFSFVQFSESHEGLLFNVVSLISQISPLRTPFLLSPSWVLVSLRVLCLLFFLLFLPLFFWVFDSTLDSWSSLGSMTCVFWLS